MRGRDAPGNAARARPRTPPRRLPMRSRSGPSLTAWRRARPAGRSARSSRTSELSRYGSCTRSSSAASSRSALPDAAPAPSSAERATVNAASACGISAGRDSRAAAVPTRFAGTSATGSSGSVSAMRAMRPSQLRVTPPASAAARLSACGSSVSPSVSRSSADASGAPARSPSAIAAALEPRPLSSGMRFTNRKRLPARSATSAYARTARFDPSSESSPAPSPSTEMPSPSVSSSSFQRSSATPAQSKPGPRFADVAGARTITARPSRSRPGRGRPCRPEARSDRRSRRPSGRVRSA